MRAVRRMHTDVHSANTSSAKIGAFFWLLFLTPGILPSAASPPALLFAPLLRRSAPAKKSNSLPQGVKALLSGR
jgi:hypothetical protein